MTQTDTFQRAKILRSSGSDPGLIQELLIDAKLLEILKDNLAKQSDTLRSFPDWYQNESMRTLHEQPLDEVREKMVEFTRAGSDLQKTTEKRLRDLTESSQNLIQLVSSVRSAFVIVRT